MTTASVSSPTPRKKSRLASRVRRGLRLIAAAQGLDRMKLAAYLGWDFAAHVAGVPVVRREMRLSLEGCRCTVETFSSQLGAYLDIFHDGVYEIVSGFRSKPGDIVIDAGANVGFFALQQSSLVGPAGRVYAFEPNPHIYGLLEQNVAENGGSNVECRRLALSASEGSAKFAVAARGSSCGHLLVSTPKQDEDVFEVPTTTLDRFVESAGIERIDLLKMDTEGAETDIVRGGLSKALAITRRVVMESHQTRYDVRDLLIPLGFELVYDGRFPNVVYFERPQAAQA